MEKVKKRCLIITRLIMQIICHCPLSTNKVWFPLHRYLFREVEKNTLLFLSSKNLKENMIQILSRHLPTEKKQGSGARFCEGAGGFCHRANLNRAFSLPWKSEFKTRNHVT